MPQAAEARLDPWPVPLLPGEAPLLPPLFKTHLFELLGESRSLWLAQLIVFTASAGDAICDVLFASILFV